MSREGWFIAKRDFQGVLSNYNNRPPEHDWIDQGKKIFATYTTQNTVEYSKTAKSSIIWTLSVKEFERNTEPFCKEKFKVINAFIAQWESLTLPMLRPGFDSRWMLMIFLP